MFWFFVAEQKQNKFLKTNDFGATQNRADFSSKRSNFPSKLPIFSLIFVKVFTFHLFLANINKLWMIFRLKI